MSLLRLALAASGSPLFLSLSATAAQLQKVDFSLPAYQGTGTNYTITGRTGVAPALGTNANGTVMITSGLTPANFSRSLTGTVDGSYLDVERPAIYDPAAFGTGTGANGQVYLTLDQLNGSGSGMSVSFDMAAPNATADQYSNNYVTVEYKFDGGAWTEVPTRMAQPGILGLVGISGDTNGDGVTDTTITTGFVRLTRTIAGIFANSAQFRLRLFSGTDDEFAIDNFTVSGTFIPTAIPEPSTYGLMGAGALGGFAMIRRRRRSL
jgi:hypothetical protein